MLVWLVLGFFWLGVVVFLGDLIHPAIGPLWLASAVVLAFVVAWWMVRARRDPRAVAALACWWFVATIFGPAALVVTLPWFRGFRLRSLGWITFAVSDHDVWRWQDLGLALLLHVVAAFSWLFFCGGFLAALTLPNNGPTPSDLGVTLFFVVPAALWAVAAGVMTWRVCGSGSSPTDVVPRVSGTWWVVSAIVAYALVFAV